MSRRSRLRRIGASNRGPLALSPKTLAAYGAPLVIQPGETIELTPEDFERYRPELERLVREGLLERVESEPSN